MSGRASGGAAVGDAWRPAWFESCTTLLVAGIVISTTAEQSGNPALTAVGVGQAATSTQSGGNMEGKEVRFGSIQSAFFAAATTGTSTGSVDSSHDSMMPIGGMVPMVQMQLSEVRLATLAILIDTFSIPCFTALSVLIPQGKGGR